MRTAASRWSVLVGVALVTGCATVRMLEFPATRVKVTDRERPEKLRQVWLSKVDLFAEHESDPKKVCVDKSWNAKVNAQGVAVLDLKSSTRVVTPFSMDSAVDALERSNQAFAVCVQREDDSVEYLTTAGTDVMVAFTAGATLRVECDYNAGAWNCTSSFDS